MVVSGSLPSCPRHAFVVPTQKTIERRCGLDLVFEIRRRAARRADARPGGVRSLRQEVVKDPGAGPTSSPAPIPTRSATRAGGPRRTRPARRVQASRAGRRGPHRGPAAVGAVRPMAVVERHEVRADRGELGETRHKPVVRADRLFPGTEYALDAAHRDLFERSGRSAEQRRCDCRSSGASEPSGSYHAEHRFLGKRQ